MGKEKKEKQSLNNFTPEEHSLEDRVEVLETHLTEIIKNLKTKQEQIDALKDLYGMISDTVKAVEEKTYPGDIANAIREIKDVLAKQRDKEVCICPDEKPTPTTDLTDIPNRDLLDIEYRENTIIIKPKQFLGDLWSPIMDFVRTKGGNWIKDDRNSRWQIGGVPPSTTQPKKKPQIKDPDAPATPKQIALLEKLKVFIKPDLTKGAASKLIDNKLGEKKK